MRRSRVLLVAVLALVLAFASTASAFATVIPVPDAAYLGATTKINLAPYYYVSGWPPPLVPAISDGVVTVTFSAPEMFAAWAPEASVHANAWGDDGVVEATTPTPGRTATYVPPTGVATTTMSFSTLVKTFGFEASSLWQTVPSGYTATVTFKRGGATVDTITKVIPAPTLIAAGTYQQHAQFFAATSDALFDQVVITLSGGASGQEAGLFIAQYRYDLPDPPPPVVDTPASSAWSLIVLAAAGVALVAVGRKRALSQR